MHADFIHRLGGGTVVARELARLAGGVSDEDFVKLRDTVYKARINGVPWRWRNRFAEIAGRKGVPLPKGFLDPDCESEPEKIAAKPRNSRNGRHAR